MRDWGAEALAALVKAGLTFSHDPPLPQNQVNGEPSLEALELTPPMRSCVCRPWISYRRLIVLDFQD